MSDGIPIPSPSSTPPEVSESEEKDKGKSTNKYVGQSHRHQVFLYSW
mgnify:CR=1 FL=1